MSVGSKVCIPLHHKVQKFSSGTGSSGWSRKKGRKTVVLVVVQSFLSYDTPCFAIFDWFGWSPLQ